MIAFCIGGLMAVPLAASLDHTRSHGDALGTPVEAVDTVPGTQLNLNRLVLGSGVDEIGLSRALARDRRPELLNRREG
jgi:hypothetical protein